MKRILFIFITSFIFFCPYVVDAASISFLGTTTVGEVGDNITVKVTVNEPTGLGSWEYKLNYDTSKLKLLSGNTHVVDYVNGEGETSKSYTYTFKVVRAGSTVISVADATVASWDEVITTPTASTVISLKGNYWSYENGYWYYYKDENKLQGFQEIDGKTYFFSYVNSALKYGLQVLDGKTFYLNEKGEVQYGWHNVDGFRYYFGSDGYAYQGFKDIEGKTYFFSYVNSALKYGWQGIDGKLFYLNEAGEVQYGWHNIGNFRYYFGSDGYAYQGFQNIDNKTYFFSYVNSALKYGWQGIDGKLFYLTSEGVLFEGKGFQTIEGKSYYFEDNYAVRGYKEIEGNTYYFDSVTGEFRTGLHLINGNECYYNEYGILTKIQYNPVYYSQKDERWSGIVFGLGDMKNTGCLPTALAMAFQSILGYTITPFNVANYLYNNTIEYNKLSTGASGLAIQYAATYYKVPWKGLANKQEAIQALSSGKVVIATVGPGKFTVAPYTHTIVIYKYSNGNTYALDPYNSNKNGWVSFDTVWNEQSTNSYDLRGDFAFYVLG